MKVLAFEHIPVLYEEVLEGLDLKEGGTYVDGTVGGGGHSGGGSYGGRR